MLLWLFFFSIAAPAWAQEDEQGTPWEGEGSAPPKKSKEFGHEEDQVPQSAFFADELDVYSRRANYFGVTNNDVNGAGVKDALGIKVASEYWWAFGPLFQLMFQPAFHLQYQKREMVDPEEPAEGPVSVGAPILGVSIQDLFTVGKSFGHRYNNVRPFIGLGYSGSVFYSTYNVNDTRVTSSDILHHLDFGFGARAEFAEKYTVLGYYVFADNPTASRQQAIGKQSISVDYENARWSNLVLEGAMASGHDGLYMVRYEAETITGRPRGSAGRNVMTTLSFGWGAKF